MKLKWMWRVWMWGRRGKERVQGVQTFFSAALWVMRKWLWERRRG
jgi:hypothetical protein